MKLIRPFLSVSIAGCMLLSTPVAAQAADYSFSTDSASDYYTAASYEDAYGSQYNYCGPNVVDHQLPDLEYGSFSTTQTGAMERTWLPGLTEVVATIPTDGGYGTGSGAAVIVDIPRINEFPVYQQPAYTSVDGMQRSDGSIGTLKIPSLGIDMRTWEGETNASMAKGLGHYSSTSAWDGNVGFCGHNRGTKYIIGAIKDLEIGDTITYTTVYGMRTYQVSMVKTIESTDWSYLQATSDNRVTLTTCLADHPDKRVCVQAVQI